MTHRTHAVAAALALALVAAPLAAPARSQALFAPPGSPSLTLVYETFALSSQSFIAVDKAGYVAVLEGGPSFQVSVYLPSDRAGTFRSLDFPSGVDFGGITWDMSAFLFARVAAGSVIIYRVSSDDVLAVPPDGILTVQPLATFDTSDHPWLAGNPADLSFAHKPLLGTPDGLVCLAFDAGVACLDPRPGASPRVLPVVATDQLDAIVAPRPGWQTLATGAGAPPEIVLWQFESLTPAADGRVYATAVKVWESAESSPGVRRVVAIQAVVAGAPGGDPALVFGPVLERESSGDGVYRGWSPLGRGILAWDPTLEAVVALRGGWDVGWSDPADFNADARGTGLRVLEPGGRGSGYLSLSQALLERQPQVEDHFGSFNTPNVQWVQTGPGGLLVHARWQAAVAPPQPEQIFRLSLDPAGLDLDSDGLSAAAEAALGTSDWYADSDGGTTSDPVEAALDATDPRDGHDDAWAAREEAGATWFVASPLVRWALPPDALEDNLFWDTTDLGRDAPFCLHGTCWAPGGAVVARYPDDGAEAVTSADSSYIATVVADGVHRTFFEGGLGELYIPAAAVHADLTGARLLPVDPERTWIVAGTTVLFCRYGEDCRVVFDLATARADSGVTTAPTEQARQGGWYEVWVERGLGQLGWDPVHERVQFQVDGSHDGWLVSVGEEADPRVVERSHAWVGANADGSFFGWDARGPASWVTPLWSVPAGRGDQLTDHGLVTASRSYLNTAFSLAVPDTRAPKVVWGGTLLTVPGVYELVRYPHRLDPGDVVVLRAVSIPVDAEGNGKAWMLFRSGPRGGLAPLWDAPRRDIGDVGGIDVNAQGGLCVVDRERGRLRLFEPLFPASHVPELGVESAEIPGALDCLIDPDDSGVALVLIDHAPWLVRRSVDGEVTVADDVQAEIPPTPIALRRGAGGEVVVEGDDPAVRGRLVLRDGRVASVPADTFEIQVDGQPIVTLPRFLFVSFQETTLPGLLPSRLKMVERPDGKLVVFGCDVPRGGEGAAVQGGIWLADLDKAHVMSAATGVNERALPLGVDLFIAHFGAGVAVVPGGVAAGDPWSGAGAAGYESASGAGAPVPPRAQEGRLLAGPPSGGGCRGGGPVPAWLATVGLWLLVRSRRGRVRT